jgi:structural maintenance of chromosome 1
VTVSDKLEVVKRDRKNLFMNFFLNLRPILIKTYQMLTENSDGVPGKVDLYLENEDFPCDDGIYYFPTPPTKRFVYDLDQLSGGEKSLASLALQYSIAIASKSPFLMLDEIDAFLDAANVLKFVKLVNESIKGSFLSIQKRLCSSSW